MFHRKCPCLSFSSIKDQFPGKWVEFRRSGRENNEFCVPKGGNINVSVDRRSLGKRGDPWASPGDKWG